MQLKFTTATLVTLTAIIAAVIPVLQHNANTTVAAVGAVLAAVYNVCHAFLNAPATPADPDSTAPAAK